MRKSFFITCLCLLAVSCTNKNSYTINGTIPEEYNGQFVYLFDYDQNMNLDSALVADGKFTFTGLSDATTFIRLKSEDESLFSNVILEAGIINVDLSNRLNVSGTPLNDKLIEYQIESRKIRDKTNEILANLEEEYEDDEAGYEKAYEKEVNIYTTNNEIFNTDYILVNKDNAIGIFVFMNTYYDLSVGKVDSLYALLGENIKQSPKIQDLIALNEKKKLTAVGQVFVDFTIENGNIDGTPVSFSDYIGKGKYVLVDFWASWCGPCIAENPVIAEVYKKHKGDKFEVLGVAVWDKRDDTLKAIEKLNIAWPQIIDAQQIPTDIYGIDGIPHIILFGPDGTILARDLRGVGLKAKVAEVLQ